jgi:hypothetical protein
LGPGAAGFNDFGVIDISDTRVVINGHKSIGMTHRLGTTMRTGLMTAGLDDTAPEEPAANCLGDLLRPADVSCDDGRRIWNASSTGIPP